MKNSLALLLIFIVIICVFPIARYVHAADPTAAANATQQLRAAYQAATKGSKKIKILIVPGHDADHWGTEYRGALEADLNFELAQKIYASLKRQKGVTVKMPREKSQYISELRKYFVNQQTSISQFRREHLQSMNVLLEEQIIKPVEGVYHNNVIEEVANRLYGINKWANENEFDIILNIHFNDTPERKRNRVGPYKGIAVYVPDKQLNNGPSSIELGGYIYKQLAKKFATSNMPKESAGVIEDQKLIALGANNTLNPLSVLIEYGYIYEPKIIKQKNRGAYEDKAAKQTVAGIMDYLKGL